MVKLEKKGIMLFEKDLKPDGHSLTQSLGCGLIPRVLFKSQGIKLSNVNYEPTNQIKSQETTIGF